MEREKRHPNARRFERLLHNLHPVLRQFADDDDRIGFRLADDLRGLKKWAENLHAADVASAQGDIVVNDADDQAVAGRRTAHEFAAERTEAKPRSVNENARNLPSVLKSGAIHRVEDVADETAEEPPDGEEERSERGKAERELEESFVVEAGVVVDDDRTQERAQNASSAQRKEVRYHRPRPDDAVDAKEHKKHEDGEHANRQSLHHHHPRHIHRKSVQDDEVEDGDRHDIEDDPERHFRVGEAAAHRDAAVVRNRIEQLTDVEEFNSGDVAIDDNRGNCHRQQPQPARTRLQRHADETDGDEKRRKEIENPRRLALAQPDGTEDAVVQVILVRRHHPPGGCAAIQKAANHPPQDGKRRIKDWHTHRQKRNADRDEVRVRFVRKQRQGGKNEPDEHRPAVAEKDGGWIVVVA